MKEFSKKMLFLDYLITGIMLVLFFIFVVLNGIYVEQTTSALLANGIDVSAMSISVPFQLDAFGVVIGAWIAQLGISSGCYYIMARSDHRVQLPLRLINDMPEDIKQSVDMTQVITTVLSTSDN